MTTMLNRVNNVAHWELGIRILGWAENNISRLSLHRLGAVDRHTQRLGRGDLRSSAAGVLTMSMPVDNSSAMAINEGDGEADKGPVGPEDIASTPAQTSFWTTHENKGGGEILIGRTDGHMRDQINMEQISFLPDQRRSKSEEEARHEKQILQWVDFARPEERRECEYGRAKNHGICHDSWAMGGILEKDTAREQDGCLGNPDIPVIRTSLREMMGRSATPVHLF
ncbi:hypothetical protein B0H13DRAFT_1889308 [Mycena leptocephala]|nr:hypothetical protein B0H13DRAFT_1889308 [Mycena leptocephala]